MSFNYQQLYPISLEFNVSKGIVPFPFLFSPFLHGLVCAVTKNLYIFLEQFVFKHNQIAILVIVFAVKTQLLQLNLYLFTIIYFKYLNKDGFDI